jgi:SAM-dependent methyltransferase
VSKAQDESSRRLEAQGPEGAAPDPVDNSGHDGLSAKETALGRRPRPGVPPERSGPIGIASGDFATPSVRRRTTTQPRGTPAIGLSPALSDVPLPLDEARLSAAVPVGATPVDLVDPASIRQTPDAPLAADSPFHGSPSSSEDLDNEAAVLAAEAAAVRALDSGPMTPLPELVAVPLPSAEIAALSVTPGPEVAEKTTMSGAPPEPADAREVEVAGAVPVRPMGGDGSAASADFQTSAASLVTPAPIIDGEGETHGIDDIEVVDGIDGKELAADGSASPATETPEPSRPTSVASSSPRPTPPPIPGSYLKTPGPEPRSAPPPVVDEAHGPLLPALPILPEALMQRPRRPKRSKPWFEEVFDEDYLRTLPFMRADQTVREAEFVSNALQAEPGAEILDVGCGYGRHAIELVQRGFNVTGLDLSLPLLIRAADEAQRRALSVNFVHADMREMAFEKQFDGAYSMLTSFGYFDEETNLRVAERIGRALKPGRRFLLDVVNRDYVVADLPVRVWWEGTGCVVLEEVDFNFHTSRINTHRSIVFEDGRQVEQELSVRAYSLHEIGRLLRQAGFRVIDVSGGLAVRGQFFGAASRSLLIVAEKREEDAA